MSNYNKSNRAAKPAIAAVAGLLRSVAAETSSGGLISAGDGDSGEVGFSGAGVSGEVTAGAAGSTIGG